MVRKGWVAIVCATWIVSCSSEPQVVPDAGMMTVEDATTGPCGAGASTKCGDLCVNLKRDFENCGACGKACGAGQICASGSCVSSCSGAMCGNACVNLASDAQNCGKCGNTCAQGMACVAAACATLCGSADAGGTTIVCGAQCTDVLSDARNCGACGKACKSYASCVGGACIAPASCLALHNAHMEVGSGVQDLDPDGASPNPPFAAYCDMTGNGGGWTLIMKIDGTKSTFAYAAAIWTNTSTYQESFPDLDSNEAKLAGFMTMPFAAVRLGMVDGATRWLTTPVSASSMLSLLQMGYTATSLGRGTWKSLLADPSLQSECNLEGFNAVCGGDAACRIGIVSNNESDCASCDSRVGFGCVGSYCGQDNSNTCGNEATCTGDNGDKSVKTFGYVMVR